MTIMTILIFAKNWIHWTNSFVAFGHASRTKKTGWRIWWSLLAIVLIVFFIIQSTSIIQGYFQYGKNTNIQLFDSNNLEFPAVTFCNLNPFKKSEVNSVPSLKLLLEAYNYIVAKRKELYDTSYNTTGGENVTFSTTTNNGGADPSKSTTTSKSDESQTTKAALSTSSIKKLRTTSIGEWQPTGYPEVSPVSMIATPLPQTEHPSDIIDISDRRKRQADNAATTTVSSKTTTDWSSDCPESSYSSQYQSGVVYDIKNCSSSAKIDVSCGDGSTHTISVMVPLSSTYIQYFDAEFIYCAKSKICGNTTNVCVYPDEKALGLLEGIGNCMVNNQSSVTYPMTNSSADDPIDVFTKYLASKCNYNTGTRCSFHYEKVSNMAKYYWYRSCSKNSDCNDMNKVGHTSKVTYTSNCNASEYTAAMSQALAKAYFEEYCDGKCSYSCPYANDDKDCGNMHYYDDVCSLYECTSTTTPEETTTEATTSSTSTSTSTSTTTSTSTVTTTTTSPSKLKSTTTSTSTVTTTSTSPSTSKNTTTSTSTITTTSTSPSTTMSTMTSTSARTATSTLTSTTTSVFSITTTSTSTSTTTSTITRTSARTTRSTSIITSTVVSTSTQTSRSTSTTTNTTTSLSTSTTTSTLPIKTTSTSTSTTMSKNTTSRTPSNIAASTSTSTTSTPIVMTTTQGMGVSTHTLTSASMSTFNTWKRSTQPRALANTLSMASTNTLPNTTTQTAHTIFTTTSIKSSTTTSTTSRITTKSKSYVTTNVMSRTKTKVTKKRDNSTVKVSPTTVTITPPTKRTTNPTTPTLVQAAIITHTKSSTSTLSNASTLTKKASNNTNATSIKITSQKTQSSTLTKLTSTRTSNKGPTDAYKSTSTRARTITITTTASMSTATDYEDYLRKVADNYGLSEYDNQVTLNAKVSAAMEAVAAGLTTAERDVLCFTLPELISTCMINAQPCDMHRDFSRMYDVDYGYCYTFNYYLTDGKYNTTHFDHDHGLVVIMRLNVSEYLESTEYVGGKVVIHHQNVSCFPNEEGFLVAPNKSAHHVISRSVFELHEDKTKQFAIFSGTSHAERCELQIKTYSRLSSPYGSCDTLDDLDQRGQPYYFNGTYTTEGCLRSCFQKNIINACGCYDSRFPKPTNMNITNCNPMNTTQYTCYANYIDENGDYYNVNCTCQFPCDEVAFSADAYLSNWPRGTFFYDAECGTKNAADCNVIYESNNVQVSVYYVAHSYSSITESPDETALDVLNDLYGNTGLWIGWCVLSVAEFVLVLLQCLACVLCCKREVPEVPSCRHRNYRALEYINDSEGEFDDRRMKGRDGSERRSYENDLYGRGQGKSYFNSAFIGGFRSRREHSSIKGG